MIMTTADMGVLANLIIAKAQSPAADQVITTFIDETTDTVQTRTYKELYQNANAIAAFLLEQGMEKGDRFSALLQNHPEMVECLIAASITGAVIVPIDPRTKGDKLTFILDDSNCKGIFCANYNMENVVEIASKTGIDWSVIVNGSEQKLPDLPMPVHCSTILEKSCPPIAVNCTSAEDTIQILYTSGTTGDPKGIVKSSKQLMLGGMLYQLFDMNKKDVLYTGLSLTHGNAQALTLSISLMAGIPSVFSQRFTKSRLWSTVRRFNCTVFNLLGGMTAAIYAESIKPDDADNPIRLVLSAGMPAVIWADFEKRFGLKLFEAYGAAEGGMFWNDGSGPIGSMGNFKNNPLFEARIVDENDNDVEPEQQGELIWRNRDGNPVVVKYLNNPEASAKKTANGWFRTGDIVHANAGGWLFFGYRAGGGIRHNGDFINPGFIEKVLAEIDSLSDVYIYGVPSKSGSPGEKDVVAAVVPNQSTVLNPDEIFATCREKLESNFVPSYLQVVTEIPKTASEKPQEHFLLELFSDDPGSVFTEKR